MSKSLYTSPEIEKMVERNQNLISYVLSREFSSRINDEDLWQVGMIGLWRAACLYDASKGAFSTYAYYAIKSEILMAITRYQMPYERHVVLDIESILQKSYFTEIDYIDIDSIAAQMDHTQEFIFRRLLEGYLQCDIAHELHISESKICKIVKGIRSIVADALEIE